MDDVPDTLENVIVRAVTSIVRSADFRSAEISVTILSDEAIHEANRQYLEHDYATDVLSFRLDDGEDSDLPLDQQCLEGEVLVSWDTAKRESTEFDWEPADECLLYVVHGCLHLVGHDDKNRECRQAMRQAERNVMALFGLTPRYAEEADGSHEEVHSLDE